MKTLFAATLSFLLLAFATRPLSGRPDPVLDINGNEVKINRDYYVVSVFRGARGGGLTLYPGRNNFCPLDVGQDKFQRGIKIRFFPVDNSSIVHESTDLNVIFPIITRCRELAVWKVDKYDDSRGKWFITTGGVPGNPGYETSRNWFMFQRSGSSPGIYRFVHCSSVCSSCVKVCNTVGVAYDDDRRLAFASGDESDFSFRVIPAGESSGMFV